MRFTVLYVEVTPTLGIVSALDCVRLSENTVRRDLQFNTSD